MIFFYQPDLLKEEFTNQTSWAYDMQIVLEGCCKLEFFNFEA